MPQGNSSFFIFSTSFLSQNEHNIKHSTLKDSLIYIAHDYFMNQEDKQRKALVLYLKGCIYNENESEKAQKLFLEVAENAEEAKKTFNYAI